MAKDNCCYCFFILSIEMNLTESIIKLLLLKLHRHLDLELFYIDHHDSVIGV